MVLAKISSLISRPRTKSSRVSKSKLSAYNDSTDGAQIAISGSLKSCRTSTSAFSVKISNGRKQFRDAFVFDLTRWWNNNRFVRASFAIITSWPVVMPGLFFLNTTVIAVFSSKAHRLLEEKTFFWNKHFLLYLDWMILSCYDQDLAHICVWRMLNRLALVTVSAFNKIKCLRSNRLAYKSRKASPKLWHPSDPTTCTFIWIDQVHLSSIRFLWK